MKKLLVLCALCASFTAAHAGLGWNGLGWNGLTPNGAAPAKFAQIQLPSGETLALR